MLYDVYINKAMAEVIVDDDDSSGYSYLDPHYRSILIEMNMEPDIIEDRKVDWQWLREVLDLEVTRRNRVTDKSRFVADWLFSIITSTIDPAMISEENELMKNMMEYMKLNHELNEREAEIERKEEIQEKKSNIVELMPGINFSKRGAK